VADSPDLRGITVNPWTLTFSDPAFERQFHQSWLNATARVDRYWVFGGLGFLAVFTALLVILLPADHQKDLWILYAFMLPVVTALQIPVFLRTRRQHLLCTTYFIGSFIVFGTALYLFVTAHRDHNLLFLFEMAAVFVFCQQFNRVLFRHSIVFSLIASGATISAIIIDPGLIGIPVAPAVFAVFAHAMVGIFSNYGRELFVRRNYLSMKVLKAEGERNAQLAEQANVASEAKSRFLAVVGHELRTPLNAVIGYADTIQAGILGPVTNARVRSAMGDIHSSGQRLLGIVDDILELSKANIGALSLKEEVFDPATLIGESVMAFEAECARHNIELDARLSSAGPRLHADRRLVRRMLHSLLSNAIKYSNAEGHVRIEIVPMDGGCVAIEIEDDGIGIEAEKLANAMAMFGQVEDGLDRRYEGLGINLPLARSLIELHGGAIEVDSEVGKGTLVRLTFPAERVLQVDTQPSSSAPSAA
jgi:signal transduction histidine kinase